MAKGGHFHGVRWPWRETDHSSPPSAMVRNEWSSTSIPPNIFMAFTGRVLSCTYICPPLQQFSLLYYLIMKKQSHCLSIRATFLRIYNYIHRLLGVAFIMLTSIDYSGEYTNKACSRNNFKNSPTLVNSPTSIILLFQMSRWWEHTGREVRCNK